MKRIDWRAEPWDSEREKDRILVCTPLDTSKVVPSNHFSPTHAVPLFIMGFCVARVEPTGWAPRTSHFIVCPYLCPFQLNVTSDQYPITGERGMFPIIAFYST